LKELKNILKKQIKDLILINKMGHIVSLVGPRAVGKSTIGRELQKLLRCHLIDLDRIMLDKLKHQGDIFSYANEHGWNKYFKFVNSVLKDIFEKNKDKDLILDLGGGTIASEFSASKDNAELVKKNSNLILILPSRFDKISLNIILKREHARDKTGINTWAKDWPKEKFEKKIKDDFNLRVPIFKKYANIIVYTRFKNSKQVAENILKKIKK